MSRSRKRITVVAVVAGIVALLTAGSPAVAVPDSASVSPHVSSRYLAGYRATADGHVSDVIVKAVTVPDTTCPGTHFRGIALGAGSEPAVGQREYFAGVLVQCFFGQAQYNLDALAGTVDNQTGVEPGDQVQIVISLSCDAFPTCRVFANATDLNNESLNVVSESDVTITSDTAVFGAFPVFEGSSQRPAPVPAFDTVSFQGCLFGNGLLDNHAQRVIRQRNGVPILKPGRVDVGSFQLRHL